MNDDRYMALISEFLCVHGTHVVASSKTNGAVEVVERDSPQVVILDLDAEGTMTGRTLLELLRLGPSTQHIPIIGLTWNTVRVLDIDDSLQDHHIQILHKPFDPADLYRLVDESATTSGSGNSQRDWDWSFESKS